MTQALLRVILPGFMLAAPEGMAWVLRGRWLTAANWVRAVPGVTLARPPAVAVVGLRRSGRTGNGESP